MAVYTKIYKQLLESFLKNYKLGNLISFEGIKEGVENTNYKIITSKDSYILTIFEKRVKEHELPFFIDLQNHLSNKNIKCPKPIADQNKNYINKIENKPCVITTFLSGQKIDIATPHHCYQVGEQLAKIHQQTTDFTLKRENNLHQKNWIGILDKCKISKNNQYNEFFETIENNLKIFEKYWPVDLPKGIIHADVFQDNVFFKNNTLSGFIDFYFACNDFYAYELAICINAWCFNKDIPKKFNSDKCASLLKGYQKTRVLTSSELDSMTILLKGAAMRILLTRLHDILYHSKEALVSPKDPKEYLYILNFYNTRDPIELISEN